MPLEKLEVRVVETPY